jgi:hypothetical protein
MTRYNLVFRGQILQDASLDEVKDNLARLFKADAKKIARLFSGKPVVIKKELDPAAAKKYLQVFKKAGAKALAVKIAPDVNDETGHKIEHTQDDTSGQTRNSVHSPSGLSGGLASLVNYNSNSNNSNSKNHPENHSRSSIPTTTVISASNTSTAEKYETVLTLAAANEGTFPKSSSKVTIDMPDISHLSMSPPKSGSLEEYAEIIIPIVIPDTQHITLGDPRSGNLAEFIQPVEAVELPDISSIKLAEQDGQDLSAESKKSVPVEIPHTCELNLSVEGKDDNKKSAKKSGPVEIPDVSHLHLETIDNINQIQGKAIFKID